MKDKDRSKGRQEDRRRTDDRRGRDGREETREHTDKSTVGTRRKCRTEVRHKRTYRECSEEREMESAKKRKDGNLSDGDILYIQYTRPRKR